MSGDKDLHVKFKPPPDVKFILDSYHLEQQYMFLINSVIGASDTKVYMLWSGYGEDYEKIRALVSGFNTSLFIIGAIDNMDVLEDAVKNMSSLTRRVFSCGLMWVETSLTSIARPQAVKLHKAVLRSALFSEFYHGLDASDDLYVLSVLSVKVNNQKWKTFRLRTLWDVISHALSIFKKML